MVRFPTRAIHYQQSEKRQATERNEYIPWLSSRKILDQFHHGYCETVAGVTFRELIDHVTDQRGCVGDTDVRALQLVRVLQQEDIEDIFASQR